MCDSKSISECKNCEDKYCINCSDAEDYAEFCSKVCEDEFNQATKNEQANLEHEYDISRGC